MESGEHKGCCGPHRAAAREAVAAGAAGTGEPQPGQVALDLMALDLVALPGGQFLMGSEDPCGFPQDGEGPVRTVELSPFAIGRYPVRNREFAAFVDASGYVTEAERYGWSFVFAGQLPPGADENLPRVASAPWWCQVEGASWQTPAGPGSTLDGLHDHPVVHVTWNDAESFCAWAGGRLPTEAEWEYAARGGLARQRYPWGDDLLPGGEHRCNIWQGVFPTENTEEDGFAATCPADAFPPNGFGLFSMTGNTWEWCADWWSAEPAQDLRHNPRGPAAGTSRVIRGGSFLCHSSYCNRYRAAARTSNTPESSTSHMGFRYARSWAGMAGSHAGTPIPVKGH